ncbi:hypothetical protein Y032_0339g2963 [Ancylostoma ceylanicum]|uniref:Uncharacterized protein n=1 Tax=Ancylostoma ceylanicum TaxID=53326 RepID=A0A016RXZ9_9BILA|nr:hypothetical protein Y032_0339g2963 [Ancylostoma ceylanicum]
MVIRFDKHVQAVSDVGEFAPIIVSHNQGSWSFTINLMLFCYPGLVLFDALMSMNKKVLCPLVECSEAVETVEQDVNTRVFQDREDASCSKRLSKRSDVQAPLGSEVFTTHRNRKGSRLSLTSLLSLTTVQERQNKERQRSEWSYEEPAKTMCSVSSTDLRSYERGNAETNRSTDGDLSQDGCIASHNTDLFSNDGHSEGVERQDHVGKKRPTSYPCVSYEQIPNLLDALIPARYLKCPKMASKPVFRDGTCPVVAGSQLGANPAPAPRSGYIDSIKDGVFVTSVTFAVHYWDKRGEKVKNLLISQTYKTTWTPAVKLSSSRISTSLLIQRNDG